MTNPTNPPPTPTTPADAGTLRLYDWRATACEHLTTNIYWLTQVGLVTREEWYAAVQEMLSFCPSLTLTRIAREQ